MSKIFAFFAFDPKIYIEAGILRNLICALSITRDLFLSRQQSTFNLSTENTEDLTYPI